MARRSGLGRGLGALIPSGEDPRQEADLIDLRERTFRDVPVSAIRVNTYQPRHNAEDADLKGLADSIKELGVLQPILVRADGKDRYELIAGERRWRAAQKAGLKHIPVIVRDAGDVQSLEQALVENLHRKDLNALDEAAAYRQLIDDFSMTHEEIGRRVGKSRAAITNLLRLLQLPPKIQKFLGDNKLTEGHARALLGTEDEAFQLQLAERITREGLSVRAVEDAVRLRTELAKPQTRKRSARTRSHGGEAAVLEWQERLTDRLDTRVKISMANRRGRITIDFADLDDLDRISGLIDATVRR